jgi:hypothetical protein
MRSAHLYRKINDGMGWNIANCLTGENLVSIGLLLRVSEDLSSLRVIRPAAEGLPHPQCEDQLPRGSIEPWLTEIDRAFPARLN